MSSENDWKEIQAVLAARHPLVIMSHVDPDSDAYGSMCGLGLSLLAAGREVVCVNESGVLDRSQNFPGVELVRTTLPEGPQWKDVIVCDCGDLKRVGDRLRSELLNGPYRIINIDHHHGNDRFGALNIVEGDASSTSELVFRLLEGAGIAIPKRAAEALYLGIVGDTGSFRYSNTSQETFRVAAELLEVGVQPSEMAQLLYGNARLAAVRLQARAVLDMQLHFEGRVSEVLVTEEMLREEGASPYDTEGLVEKGRDIEGVLIAFFIRRHDDLWKVSLRSVEERYDVSEVAASFGGGGHRSAAAFRWRNELPELKNLLLERIGAVLEKADGGASDR